MYKLMPVLGSIVLCGLLLFQEGRTAVVEVDVTIKSVNPQSRQITVNYDVGSGRKGKQLDVSRRAEITANGRPGSLDTLMPGQQAKITYEKELQIVTKIKATGSDKQPVDPGAVQHVHDPSIIKEGSKYYIFSTGGGIPIRSSTDLIHWDVAGRVFDNLPDWAKREVPGATCPWAPDISLVGNEYRLYYAISTFGHNRSCIGLAINKTLDRNSPNYHWVDRGKVIESRPDQDNWNAIDPNFVLDRSGKAWLFFGSFWGGIKAVPVDPRTGKPTGSRPNLYSVAARPDGNAIEAPFVIQRRGYFYLFVSFDFCSKGVDSTYKIIVGRSKEVTGPYRDRKGRLMSEGGGTLVLASYDHIRGPGHNAVLMDGEENWLVHHFYDGKANGVPTLQIRPLLWADDEWPLAGAPLQPSSSASEDASVNDFVGKWNHSVNFGPGHPVQYQSDGRIGNGPATWNLKEATLTLRWPRNDAPGGVWTDTCIVSKDKKWYVGRNQQDMVIRGRKIE